MAMTKTLTRRLRGLAFILVFLAGSALSLTAGPVQRAGAAPADPSPSFSGLMPLPAGVMALADGSSTPSPENGPDSALAVPWNGTVWRTMPDLTWAACDVGAHTRQAIDLAIGQWSYAASSQGIPVHLSELPCSNGSSQAQILLVEASAADLPAAPDVDVFGLTVALDENGQICGIDGPVPCVAQSADILLLTDNWEADRLTFGQAAKTIVHELGHAIGLGHAPLCNFDSIMAQNCEPILRGLGADDVQSIDALVDYDRSYFGQAAVHSQPPPPVAVPGGASVTYRAGFNLVAAPRGSTFTGAQGSLYTFHAGDSEYRTVPASQAAYSGVGYWAYFPQDVTVKLNGGGRTFISAVAKPGAWLLVGDDSATQPMTVLGADAVYVYDARSGQYQRATSLQPGQGAWAKAGDAGLIALVSTALAPSQVDCYLQLGSPSSC